MYTRPRAACSQPNTSAVPARVFEIGTRPTKAFVTDCASDAVLCAHGWWKMRQNDSSLGKVSKRAHFLRDTLQNTRLCSQHGEIDNSEAQERKEPCVVLACFELRLKPTYSEQQRQEFNG